MMVKMVTDVFWRSGDLLGSRGLGRIGSCSRDAALFIGGGGGCVVVVGGIGRIGIGGGNGGMDGSERGREGGSNAACISYCYFV